MRATPLAGLSALLPTARVAAATARPGLASPLRQRRCNSGAPSSPPRVAPPRRPLLSSAAPPGLLAPLAAPRSRSPAAPVAPLRRSLSPATASLRLCPLAALGAAPPAAPLTHTRVPIHGTRRRSPRPPRNQLAGAELLLRHPCPFPAGSRQQGPVPISGAPSSAAAAVPLPWRLGLLCFPRRPSPPVSPDLLPPSPILASICQSHRRERPPPPRSPATSPSGPPPPRLPRKSLADAPSSRCCRCFLSSRSLDPKLLLCFFPARLRPFSGQVRCPMAGSAVACSSVAAAVPATPASCRHGAATVLLQLDAAALHRAHARATTWASSPFTSKQAQRPLPASLSKPNGPRPTG
nr:proline-rich protein 36-like [Aegilops tauschii subsp. strangulata]